MGVVIGIACFTSGAWFGFSIAAALAVAKQADEEIENQEDTHGR